MHPDISLRYIAVRSGVGSFGWSGNVGLKGYGAAIILGTVVTEADLKPTEPLPESESFCDKCKLCAASCAAGMFSAKEEESVTLGGRTFKFAKRSSILSCQLVCGGFSGLHKSGRWSTWSPGRFSVPVDEKELLDTLIRASGLYASWPIADDGGYKNPAFGDSGNLRITCGNCAIICAGNRDETKENYRILTTSGCVVQDESGKKHVLPSDEAAKRFESFKPEHKNLYR
jgi:epoxyqueuosine reductase